MDKAIDDGPQVITRRGVEVAIVLSYAEYRQMIASQKKLSEFFRESPLADVDLDLSRDRDDVRSEYLATDVVTRGVVVGKTDIYVFHPSFNPFNPLPI